MTLAEQVATLREAMTVSRVFGEPYERDGVPVVPVVAVGVVGWVAVVWLITRAMGPRAMGRRD